MIQAFTGTGMAYVQGREYLVPVPGTSFIFPPNAAM